MFSNENAEVLVSIYMPTVPLKMQLFENVMGELCENALTPSPIPLLCKVKTQLFHNALTLSPCKWGKSNFWHTATALSSVHGCGSITKTVTMAQHEDDILHFSETKNLEMMCFHLKRFVNGVLVWAESCTLSVETEFLKFLSSTVSSDLISFD